MAVTFTKPSELDAATTVTGTAAIIVDNGTTVEKATPKQVVDAGRPVSSEAQAVAGTDNETTMTPLTVRQALDADTSGAVAKAQAWAESDTAPGDPGTKSAKTWAGESGGYATAAEESAAKAELFDGPKFNTIALMALYEDAKAGDVATVLSAFNGGVEHFDWIEGGSLTADGALVVDGVGGQWVSKRTVYADWAEFIGDVRLHDVGMTFEIPTIGAVYTTTADAGNIGLPNAGGNDFHVVSVTPVDVRHFGADPSATARENTLAFQRMSDFVNSIGGAEIIITGGDYTVLYEDVNPSPAANEPFYQNTGNLIKLEGCNGFTLTFRGARLIASDGLHYGSFDPITGETFENGSLFTDPAFAANPGSFIDITDCKNWSVKNANIQGILQDFVQGGRWGDVDIQLAQIGIAVRGASTNWSIENCNVEYCGLDGLYVAGTESQDLNGSIENSGSFYNGRQGLSWVGGRGLKVNNSDFAFTGRGGLASKPSAGIDIEHNGQGLADGEFNNCRVYGNVGPSFFIFNSVDIEGIRWNGGVIQNSQFIGDVDTRRALWTNSPATFTGAYIAGNCINLSTSEFIDCTLTNREWRGLGLPENVILDVSSPITLRDCKIICTQDDTNFVINGGAILERCKFTFPIATPTARRLIGSLGSAQILDTSFTAQFGDDSAVTPAGEAAFINPLGGAVLTGRNFISGSGLAWFSRAGVQNSILNPDVGISYTTEQLYTLSGTGTFDIDIGNGNYIVQLYKTSGNATLRNIAATFLQCSAASGSATLHSVNTLTERMAGGVTMAVALVGSNDVIRLTESSTPLSGEVFLVRKIALSGSTLTLA